MIQRIRLAPMNSLVVVCPPRGAIPPEPPRPPTSSPPVMASLSCLLVSCYPEVDGETTVLFGDDTELDPGTPPVFEGIVETFERLIHVEAADCTVFLQAQVPSRSTRVRIWLSHPDWPEEVRIGLS